MTHEEIITTIRNHRKSLGITLAELSERVDIRATTICDIENGKQPIADYIVEDHRGIGDED